MAAAAAAERIPSPPTYRFRPTKRELVTFYLLPSARGQDPFPGVIFEDDEAGSTLPWDLFERHGVGSEEEEAYFLVRASSEGKKAPGARQDRGCDGGVGVWKMQSSLDRRLRVRGEEVRVHVSNLSLHLGKGKQSSGSVGWVMHEYSVAAPPCSSPVKICHISFSGHGRKRMRVPERREVCQSSRKSSARAAAAGRARVGATASALPSSSSSGAMLPSAASGQHQELEGQMPTASTGLMQGIMVPQLMVQRSTMPVAVAQQLSEGELEFWSSIGVDVQSNTSFGLEQESTKVQSSWVVPNTNAMTTGVQSSWMVPSNGAMATGVESSWVVPNTGATPGDLDDFCRSIRLPNNCAAPDFGNMATGTLGGGCSLICK